MRRPKFLIITDNPSFADKLKEERELEVKGFGYKVISIDANNDEDFACNKYIGGIGLLSGLNDFQLEAVKNLSTKIYDKCHIPTVIFYKTSPPPFDLFLEGTIIGAVSLTKLENGDADEKAVLMNLIKKAFRSGIYRRYGEVPVDDEMRNLVVKPINWKIDGDSAGDGLFLMTHSVSSSDMWITIRQFIDDAIRNWRQKVITLLLTGPTGSGKTSLAGRIASAIVRRVKGDIAFEDKSLIKVNLSTIPPDLIGSELFGHEKGAFTGATKKRDGLIMQAYKSERVLFLDEIGEIPPMVQVKLLTYMDDGRYVKLGGDKEENTPVVIIGATNRDINDALKSGTLREDFIYRWQYVIRIPSLNERGRDIRLIISYLLQTDDINPVLKSGSRKVQFISVRSIEYLESLTYPGNFRELMALLKYGVQNAYGEGVNTLMIHHLLGRR